MYQIKGAQRNQEHQLVATARTAREALTHYRASQKLFSNIIVHDPDGDHIDGFDLNRRAEAERKAEENA